MLDHVQKLLVPFEITASDVKQLDGYESTNFRIKDNNANTYVLKHYTDLKEIPVLLEEIAYIDDLKSEVPFEMSYTITRKDKKIHHYSDGSFSRLLPFIEGTFLAECEHSPELLYNYGKAMGKLNMAMAEMYTPHLASRRMRWNFLNGMTNKPLMSYITESERRQLVHYYFDRFEHQCLPILNELPRQLIHNDWNDWNVLADGDEICGLIDFGDAAVAPRICELGVGMAYIMMNKQLPIAAGAEIIKGYHSVYPLTEQEVKLLPDLIAARLCISLSNSAKFKAEATDTDYITISEKGGWDLLEKWIKWNPILVENTFLSAIGFPVSHADGVKSKMTEVRRDHFSSALSLSYADPIHMSSAAFQYMYDMDGNTYLDAYNNIPLVGHSHPKVSEAVSHQIRQLNTNTRYHNASLYRYAEKLLTYFPEKLNKVFFVNSGSEANELAQRLTKTYTSRNDQIVMEMGYHGHSEGLINLSAYKYSGKGGTGRKSHICELPLPKSYNGRRSTALEYIEEAKQIIEKRIEAGAQFSSFLFETISGCGGQVPLIQGYLEEMVPWLQGKGVICISDEVQVGFGRLGNWFWGFEMQNVIPDIVVLGKPMGNGFPIAGVVTTTEIADGFDNGMEYFSSFGGNPLSTEAGLAVLEIIEKEGLQKRAKEVGLYWKEQLTALQHHHGCIGDVRGHGLFIGVEFINENGTPGTEISKHVKNALKDNYILTGTDGRYNEVLKMKPPLCFSKENVDHMVERLGWVLSRRVG